MNAKQSDCELAEKVARSPFLNPLIIGMTIISLGKKKKTLKISILKSVRLIECIKLIITN